MTRTLPNVAIKTLTDEHVQNFVGCPLKFYYETILRKSGKLQWRQMLQFVVHHVVKQYFQMDITRRTPTTVLQLLTRQLTRIKVDMFDSQEQYYMVMAQVTDHLMHFLSENRHVCHPIFLREKLSLFSQEMGVNLSLTIDVGEWNSELTIKKFIVAEEHDVIESFKHMATVFAKEAFHYVPKRIEFYSLLSGETFVYHLEEGDYEKSLHYLQLLKAAMQEQTSYSHGRSTSECAQCPLYAECNKQEEAPATLLLH